MKLLKAILFGLAALVWDFTGKYGVEK